MSQPCQVNMSIFLPGGVPASFAKIRISEVIKVLLWETESFVTSTTADAYGNATGISVTGFLSGGEVTSTTADAYGNATVTLTKGKKYRFHVEHVKRKMDFWQTLTRCPWYVSTSFKT